MTNYKIFSNRTILILGLSESISTTGSWITMMAVFNLMIFSGNGGVLASSGIYLAGLLPILLFSPTAGWLTDRFERKKLMVFSELLSGLIVLALVFISNPLWILIVIAVQAVFISVMSPARQVVISQVVDQNDLPRANALLQQMAGIIKIIAPIIAGFVLGIMNPHHAIFLNCLSFLFSAFILTKLPNLPPAAKKTLFLSDCNGCSDENWFGIIRNNDRLRLLMVIAFFTIFIIIGFDVLSAVYIRDILSGSEKLMGFIISLIGLGTLIAAVILLVKKRTDIWRDVIIGLLLIAVIPFSMAVGIRVTSPTIRLWIVMAGCLLGGIGNGLLLIQTATLLQTLSPAEYLGRMGGIYQGVITAGQLVGMMLTPLLVPGLLSIMEYFFIAAVLLVVVGVYTLLATGKRKITAGL